MTAIVLIGVMADRPALTFRSISVAALAVLVLAPEAVVNPSFQMSVAATLALIALYQYGLPWIGAGADTSLGAKVALWGVREIVALVLASFIAGLATTPYAAFHFHRLAPYGVLANLAAPMPVVSAVVMPFGILGLILMPFGYDGWCWRVMELGIDWMIAVVLWVAGLPGAVGHICAFGVGALVVGTAALIVGCLLRTPLRLIGAAIAVVAIVLAARTPQPDILIAAGGDSFAVRGPDGRLQVLKDRQRHPSRSANGCRPTAMRPAPSCTGRHERREGFGCDEVGCVAHLAGGGLVAIGTSPAALADDCRRAALVITTRTAPPGCGVTVIRSQAAWRDGGALALRRTRHFRAGNRSRPGRRRRTGRGRPRRRRPAASGSAA